MTIKNLNKNIVKKYDAFNLREDLNFSDDGNYFRGFDYKGLPITTLRADDTTYLCIRVDYLKDNQFTYNEWRKTEEYKLTDEFNGVSEIDLDKLIENCERIIAKIAEMNAERENEIIDMTPVVERMGTEIKIIDKALDEVKANLKWWELPDYKLRRAKYYIDCLTKDRKYLKEKDVINITRREKKSLREYVDNGYIRIKEDNFYIRELKEMMNE